MESLLPGLVAWLFLRRSFFLPAYRNSYNDILILAVVALGIIASIRFFRATETCLIALPLGWWIYASAPTQTWLINLPTLFFTLGAMQFICGSCVAGKRAGGFRPSVFFEAEP